MEFTVCSKLNTVSPSSVIYHDDFAVTLVDYTNIVNVMVHTTQSKKEKNTFFAFELNTLNVMAYNKTSYRVR